MVSSISQKSSSLFGFSLKNPYIAGGRIRRGESVAIGFPEPVWAMRLAIHFSRIQKWTADKVLFVSPQTDFEALSREAVTRWFLSSKDFEQVRERLFFAKEAPSDVEGFDLVLSDDRKQFDRLKALSGFDNGLVLVVDGEIKKPLKGFDRTLNFGAEKGNLKLVGGSIR